MIKDLWQECLDCKTKCCRHDISFPLFTTPEERRKNNSINSNNPCVYFNNRELCEIHHTRPFDCRFFPFELMKINKKFFWIVCDIECPITENWREDFEYYLKEHEEKLIPQFIEHLDDYADFRVEELKNKYKYEVLREAVIKLP